MIEWKLKLEQCVYKLGYNLWIFRRGNNGETILYTREGKEEVIDNGKATNEPTLYLEDFMLQLLVDELQKRNIKPKEASKIEGLYEAQSEHLRDMRTLLKLK